jgi:hypothetical protein
MMLMLKKMEQKKPVNSNSTRHRYSRSDGPA